MSNSMKLSHAHGATQDGRVMVEMSHTTSEVRSRSWEDPMPVGRWPRGVTPRPRSGASAESTRLQRRRNRQEELPHVRIHGGRPRGDTQPARSGVATRGVTPRPRSGAVAERRYPRNKARGGGREEIPRKRGQGRWPGRPAPRPRSSGGCRRA